MKEKIFETFTCLSDIEQVEWDNGNLSILKIPAGSLAFVDGEKCGMVVFLLKGCIRVFKVGESGRELTLYRIFPGESCVLMLSSVMAGVEYPASAVIEEEAEVISIPLFVFKGWMHQYESLRQFVYQLFTKRLMSVMTLVEEIVFRRMDERLAVFLLNQTSYQNPTLKITHDELSVELGTAREVVSRMLKEFEKEGALKLSRGKIEVISRDLIKEKYKAVM